MIGVNGGASPGRRTDLGARHVEVELAREDTVAAEGVRRRGPRHGGGGGRRGHPGHRPGREGSGGDGEGANGLEGSGLGREFALRCRLPPAGQRFHGDGARENQNHSVAWRCCTFCQRVLLKLDICIVSPPSLEFGAHEYNLRGRTVAECKISTAAGEIRSLLSAAAAASMAISRPRSRAVPLIPLLLLIFLALSIYSGTSPRRLPPHDSSRHTLRFALLTIQSGVPSCSFQATLELGAGEGPGHAASCSAEASRSPRARPCRRPGPPRSPPVPRFLLLVPVSRIVTCDSHMYCKL